MVKKTFTVIGNVLIWLFVAFSIVITVLSLAATSSSDGVPSIGGVTILTVSTDSMSPTFEKGDIIIGNRLTLEEARELKVDDIITYDAGDLNGDGMRDLNSHRIVEVVEAENNRIEYITKGDNNSEKDKQAVDSPNVICKYSGTRIAGLGKVLAFLQTQTGFLCVIVLPLLLFFIFELIRFIRKYVQIKNKDKIQITAEDEERIRKQAVEEYLKSQEGEKAPAEEAPAEAIPIEEEPAAEEAPAEEAPAAEETDGTEN